MHLRLCFILGAVALSACSTNLPQTSELKNKTLGDAGVLKDVSYALPIGKACTADSQCPDDGNLCNGTSACISGHCGLKPGSSVLCDTNYDTPCSQTRCNSKSGKCERIKTPAGGACEDGLACTQAGACDAQGFCKPGAPVVCPNGQACSASSGQCQAIGTTCGSTITIGSLPLTVTGHLGDVQAATPCQLGTDPDGGILQGAGISHFYTLMMPTTGPFRATIEGAPEVALTEASNPFTPGIGYPGSSSSPPNTDDCSAPTCGVGKSEWTFFGLGFGRFRVSARATANPAYKLTVTCADICMNGALKCGYDICGTYCGPCVLGERCSKPIVIDPATMHASATAIPYVDHIYDPASPVSSNGFNVAFAFTPTVTGTYRVKTEGTRHDFIVTYGCTGYPILAYSPSASESVSVTLQAGKEYRILARTEPKDANYLYDVAVTLCRNTCGDKVCGDDGCGGECGTCANGCTPDRKTCCEDACGDKVCGSNACGQTCGTCAKGSVCGADQKACVPAPGEVCSSAQAITGLPFSVTAATSGNLGDYSAILCNWGGLWGKGSNDQVWSFTPPSTGKYAVNLSADFDAVVYLASDCGKLAQSCSPGTVAMGGVPATPLLVDLEGGKTRYVIVDGVDNVGPGASGTYALGIGCQADCTGKSCAPDGCGGMCPGTCDDGNVCTQDACAALGCKHLPAPGSCNDGNACTTGENCSGSSCQSSTASCDDGNACTTDSCDTASGCKHAPIQDGSACGASQICNSGSCITGTPTPPADMAYIPGGTFQMGCVPGDSACDADEKPQHAVKIPGFFLDLNDVVFQDYLVCAEAGKCAAQGSGAKCTFGKVGFPVNCVSWSQAAAYCAWKGKRMPTEAEWERAARGGVGGKLFAWGSDSVDCSHAAYSDCGLTSPLAYGVKLAGKNAYGLTDMAGNVAQWVADFYDDKYYATSPASSPTGPDVSSSGDHVRRGGSYASPASGMRVSDRDLGQLASPEIGFRCAKNVP